MKDGGEEKKKGKGEGAAAVKGEGKYIRILLLSLNHLIIDQRVGGGGHD